MGGISILPTDHPAPDEEKDRLGTDLFSDAKAVAVDLTQSDLVELPDDEPVTHIRKRESLSTSVCGVIQHEGADLNGAACTVAILQGSASKEHREAFENIERFATLSGISEVTRDESVITAMPAPAGSFDLLPWDSWRLAQRLKYFAYVLEIVKRFHAVGEAVGTLTPSAIFVDDDFKPYLLGPKLTPNRGPYTAPESMASNQIDKQSDIYSLGKLLYFVIAKEEPKQESSPIPKLEELLTLPAGLVRIIRRATCLDRAFRYDDARELEKDLMQFARHQEVGIAHPKVTEFNLGVTSVIPRRFASQEKQRTFLDKIDSIMPVDITSVSDTRGARIFRYFATAIIFLGLGIMGANAVNTGVDFGQVSESELAGLPAAVESMSLADTTPPSFFAKVDESWSKMSLEERQELAEEIIAESDRRWGAINGFIMRDQATVAHYWNGEFALLDTLTSAEDGQ